MVAVASKARCHIRRSQRRLLETQRNNYQGWGRVLLRDTSENRRKNRATRQQRSKRGRSIRTRKPKQEETTSIVSRLEYNTQATVSVKAERETL